MNNISSVKHAVLAALAVCAVSCDEKDVLDPPGTFGDDMVPANNDKTVIGSPFPAEEGATPSSAGVNAGEGTTVGGPPKLDEPGAEADVGDQGGTGTGRGGKGTGGALGTRTQPDSRDGADPGAGD